MGKNLVQLNVNAKDRDTRGIVRRDWLVRKWTSDGSDHLIDQCHIRIIFYDSDDINLKGSKIFSSSY